MIVPGACFMQFGSGGTSEGGCGAFPEFSSSTWTPTDEFTVWNTDHFEPTEDYAGSEVESVLVDLPHSIVYVSIDIEIFEPDFED